MDKNIKLNVETLSVNKAYLGRKVKSALYRKYEEDVLSLLPKTIEGVDFNKPLIIHYTFGFSNKRSDIDNPIKPLMDILQKHYNFNDCMVYKMVVEKVIVKKGNSFAQIKIENI